MTTPENTFIASVHRKLPPEDELHREKNHNEYRGGTADVWYSGKDDLWIEYKFIELPKRDDTVLDFCTPRGKNKNSPISALQQEWLRRRHLEGRNVAVVVGCKEGGIIFTDFAWEEQVTTKEFKRVLQTREEIAEWIVSKTGTFKHGANSSTPVHKRKSSRGGVPDSKRHSPAVLHAEAITSSPRSVNDTKRKSRTAAKKGVGRGR